MILEAYFVSLSLSLPLSLPDFSQVKVSWFLLQSES